MLNASANSSALSAAARGASRAPRRPQKLTPGSSWLMPLSARDDIRGGVRREPAPRPLDGYQGSDGHWRMMRAIARRVGNAWPQAGVGAALVQRNHEIQTLTPDRVDQSLAERVRLRRPHRRLEDRQPHRRNRAIDTLGVNAVVVVDDKSMRLIARAPPSGTAGPSTPPSDGRSRSSAGSAACPLQDHEDVEHAERRRHRDEEIAGEHRPRVIAHEGAPGLRAWPTLRSGTGRHVSPNGTRRYPNPELQEQF